MSITEDLLTRASQFYEELLDEAREKDYKPGWVYHRLREEFGEEVAKITTETLKEDY